MTSFSLGRQFDLCCSARDGVDARRRGPASLFKSVHEHLGNGGKFLLTLLALHRDRRVRRAFERTTYFIGRGTTARVVHASTTTVDPTDACGP